MGYLFARSLRSVGVDAVALSEKPRSLRKDSPYDVYYGKGPNIIRRYIEDSDVIVWMHSHFIKLKRYVTSIKGKKLAVFHGGSSYRNDPEDKNEIFNPRVFVSLIQTSNMLNLGAKNQKWILPPVDIDAIQPNYLTPICKYPKDPRIIIGHYPSDPIAKNSAAINSVIKRLEKDPEIRDRFIYNYSSKLVSWEDNLDRIRGCDIYIESLSKKINGKVTDDWGVTALEAAAAGCITLSVFRSSDLYECEYGERSTIIRINNKEDLEAEIRKLLLDSRIDLLRKQRDSREWVERNHSFSAVGKRIKEALEI